MPNKQLRLFISAAWICWLRLSSAQELTEEELDYILTKALNPLNNEGSGPPPCLLSRPTLPPASGPPFSSPVEPLSFSPTGSAAYFQSSRDPSSPKPTGSPPFSSPTGPSSFPPTGSIAYSRGPSSPSPTGSPPYSSQTGHSSFPPTGSTAYSRGPSSPSPTGSPPYSSPTGPSSFSPTGSTAYFQSSRDPSSPNPTVSPLYSSPTGPSSFSPTGSTAYYQSSRGPSSSSPTGSPAYSSPTGTSLFTPTGFTAYFQSSRGPSSSSPTGSLPYSSPTGPSLFSPTGSTVSFSTPEAAPSFQFSRGPSSPSPTVSPLSSSPTDTSSFLPTGSTAYFQSSRGPSSSSPTLQPSSYSSPTGPSLFSPTGSTVSFSNPEAAPSYQSSRGPSSPSPTGITFASSPTGSTTYFSTPRDTPSFQPATGSSSQSPYSSSTGPASFSPTRATESFSPLAEEFYSSTTFRPSSLPPIRSPSVSSSYDTSPTTPRNTGIHQEGDCHGECVPFYLCKDDGTVNEDGEGIIDIKIPQDEGSCPHYLDKCCFPSNKVPNQNYTPPTPTHDPWVCGERNPEGVGFKITGDSDNEANYGEFPWMPNKQLRLFFSAAWICWLRLSSAQELTEEELDYILTKALNPLNTEGSGPPPCLLSRPTLPPASGPPYSSPVEPLSFSPTGSTAYFQSSRDPSSPSPTGSPHFSSQTGPSSFPPTGSTTYSRGPSSPSPTGSPPYSSPTGPSSFSPTGSTEYFQSSRDPSSPNPTVSPLYSSSTGPSYFSPTGSTAYYQSSRGPSSSSPTGSPAYSSPTGTSLFTPTGFTAYFQSSRGPSSSSPTGSLPYSSPTGPSLFSPTGSTVSFSTPEAAPSFQFPRGPSSPSPTVSPLSSSPTGNSSFLPTGSTAYFQSSRGPSSSSPTLQPSSYSSPTGPLLFSPTGSTVSFSNPEAAPSYQSSRGPSSPSPIGITFASSPTGSTTYFSTPRDTPSFQPATGSSSQSPYSSPTGSASFSPTTATESFSPLPEEFYPSTTFRPSSLPPTRSPSLSSSYDTSPTTPRNTGIHQEGDCHGECVPFYLCKDDGTVNEDGEGIIDIKIPKDEGSCPHYLDKCCFPSNKVPNQNYTPPTPTHDPWVCGERNPEGVGFKITGDSDNEANYGEFPWMVALLRHDEVSDGVHLKVMECGGSIIHPQVVLTAAHCVKGKKNLLIRAGEWDSQTDKEIYPSQEREVLEVIIHEGYYGGALFNDVALLVLETPLESSPVVSTICLPRQDEDMDNRHCLSSGWGKNVFGKEGRYQTILKRVELDTVPRDQCQEQLRQTRLGSHFKLHPSFLCAGGKLGKDTCKGDGGGPLVCPSKENPNIYVQAGIVAWGIGCGNNTPAVYANLPLFREWIDLKLEALKPALSKKHKDDESDMVKED